MKALFGLIALFICTSVSAYYPPAQQIVYPSSQVVYPARQIVYPAKTVIYPSRQVIHNSRRVVRVVRRRVVQTLPSVVYEEPPVSVSYAQSPVVVAPQTLVASQAPDMLLQPVVQSRTDVANEGAEKRADREDQTVATDVADEDSGEKDDDASIESSARALTEKCREQLARVPKWGWLGIAVLVLLIAWNAKRQL